MKSSAAFFTLFTVLTCFCFSEITESLQNVQLGTRSLSEEALEILRQEDYQDLENSRSSSTQEKETSKKASKPEGYGMMRSKKKDNQFFFARPHASTSHFFVSYSIDSGILELEDGSHWKVPSPSALASWRAGDVITIVPNTMWFSDYKYSLHNRNIYSSTSADLILGPIAFGSATHWVVGLDVERRKVYLENGTTWKVANSDLPLLKEWKINDTIILGTNDSWFSSYDNILINVNMNHHIKAYQY